MPSLKDLQCSVELANTNSNDSIRLREFGTTYSDGCVETFVAVPDHPQSFAVRLSSTKFIAPGLAMYVFIDGVYQCNRNRQNLKLRKPRDRKSLVNFLVRQKEEAQHDGSMVARDWSFEKLDIVSANDASNSCTGNALDHLGCIEVVVLRCSGVRNAHSAATKPMPLNLDGSGDIPDQHFGLDGWFDSKSGQIDDQWPGYEHHNNRISSSQAHSGPPPPLPSPSHNQGKYYDISEPSPTIPLSPMQRSLNSPVNVRYGSGPIPRQSRTTSTYAPAPSVPGSRRKDLPFDPQSLDSKLWAVVNRERTYPPPQAQHSPAMPPDVLSSQLPGSWPGQFEGGDSPIMRPSSFVSPILPPPGVALGLQSPQQNTHVSWQEHLPKPSQGWDDKGWGADKGWDPEAKEDNTSTWGADDPWDAPKQKSIVSARHDRTEEENASGWNFSIRSRRTSAAGQSVRTAPRSTSSEFQTARTQPQDPVWESGVDEEGWTHVKAGPGSSTEWVTARSVHPSESISRMNAPSTTTDSTKDDAPTKILLGSRLQSLKSAEHKRRVQAPPPPNKHGVPEHLRNVSHLVDGYSTIEQSVRGKLKTEDHDTGNNWGNQTPAKDDQSRRGDESVRETKSNRGSRRRSSQVSRKDTERAGERLSRPVSVAPPASPIDQVHPVETSWEVPQAEEEQEGIERWQADMNGWAAPTKAKSSVNEPNAWDALIKAKSSVNEPNAWENKSEPKKQRSESQKAKRSHTHAMTASILPSREVPPPAPARKSKSASEKAGQEAEPIIKVSREDAEKKGIVHQVCAGKGSRYGHAIGRPEYVDSLDKPYAVFRFKYRSHETLRKLLGDDAVPSDPSRLTVSPIDHLTLAKKEDPDEIKKQLENVPKDALIKGLLDMQSKLDKATAEAMQVAHTEVEGMKRTKDWVRSQSREVSERKKPDAKEDGGWDGGAAWDTKADW